MNVKKWLTKWEWGEYQQPCATMEVFESLAAERELSETRRALLEKHQYDFDDCCVSCGKHKTCSCPADCDIATALKNVGGE